MKSASIRESEFSCSLQVATEIHNGEGGTNVGLESDTGQANRVQIKLFKSKLPNQMAKAITLGGK